MTKLEQKFYVLETFGKSFCAPKGACLRYITKAFSVGKLIIKTFRAIANVFVRLQIRQLSGDPGVGEVNCNMQKCRCRANGVETSRRLQATKSHGIDSLRNHGGNSTDLGA